MESTWDHMGPQCSCSRSDSCAPLLAVLSETIESPAFACGKSFKHPANRHKSSNSTHVTNWEPRLRKQHIQSEQFFVARSSISPETQLCWKTSCHTSYRHQRHRPCTKAPEDTSHPAAQDQRSAELGDPGCLCMTNSYMDLYMIYMTIWLIWFMYGLCD